MSDEKQHRTTGTSGSSSSEHGAGAVEPEQRSRGGNASRARNQTVMLTPEITGHVRSLLAKEEMVTKGEDGEKSDPISDLLPPISWERSSSRGSQTDPSSAAHCADPFLEPRAGAVKQLGTESSPEWRDNKTGTTSFAVNLPGVGMPRAAGGPAHGATPSAHKIVARSPRSKIIGFLISFDADSNGEVYEIRAGRWLLTSRPTDHGDYILIADESISPLHAIMRATKEGRIQVLDQLSEYGSAIQKVGTDQEEDIAGSMVNVEHGDQIRFGKRRFIICLVPRQGDG